MKASSSQLERDFRNFFGMTMLELQSRVRLSHALQLLRQNVTIASVAYQCGYNDQSAFTRRFRQILGQTPTQYRQGIQQDPPATQHSSILPPLMPATWK
ncbi:AraC-like DNA-binding protein [Kerstersia gyiorum]|nr:AraC-like DNA-binding protein [Kerstersia gyiorum]